MFFLSRSSLRTITTKIFSSNWLKCIWKVTTHSTRLYVTCSTLNTSLCLTRVSRGTSPSLSWSKSVRISFYTTQSMLTNMSCSIWFIFSSAIIIYSTVFRKIPLKMFSICSSSKCNINVDSLNKHVLLDTLSKRFNWFEQVGHGLFTSLFSLNCLENFSFSRLIG